MLNKTISYFKNARSTDPTEVNLVAFLENKKHRDRVQGVRNATGEERNRLKKEVPAATISGTFTVRNMQGIKQYNGLVCLDFDAKENPTLTAAEMKCLLAEYEEVAYAGLSVSGSGVFAIIPTNNDDPNCHAKVVDILGALFAEDGLIYDRACKDVCRLRFISYDADPVITPNASVFNAKAVLPKMEAESLRRPRPLTFRTASTGDERNRERVEQYIQCVESSAQDVTNNYDDWYRLGMAIASEFGNEGEGYFLRLSQISSKYDHAAAVKKYAELLRNGRSVKIGTFFKILQNQGVRP